MRHEEQHKRSQEELPPTLREPVLAALAPRAAVVIRALRPDDNRQSFLIDKPRKELRTAPLDAKPGSKHGDCGAAWPPPFPAPLDRFPHDVALAERNSGYSVDRYVPLHVLSQKPAPRLF